MRLKVGLLFAIIFLLFPSDALAETFCCINSAKSDGTELVKKDITGGDVKAFVAGDKIANCETAFKNDSALKDKYQPGRTAVVSSFVTTNPCDTIQNKDDGTFCKALTGDCVEPAVYNKSDSGYCGQLKITGCPGTTTCGFLINSKGKSCGKASGSTKASGSSSTSDETKLFNPLDGVISSDKPVQEVAARLINAMFGIAGSIALFMFVLGGFLWLLSRGESDMVTKGKNIFIWSSLGLMVMFSSYVIVNYIFKNVLGNTGVAGTGITNKPVAGTSAGTQASKPGCCLNLNNNTVTDVAAGATCPNKLLDGVLCGDAKVCFESITASCSLFKKSESCGTATEYPTTQLAACISENANQGFCCIERSKPTITLFSGVPTSGDSTYGTYTNCKSLSPQSPKPFDGLSSGNPPTTESNAFYKGTCSSGNICINSVGCDYAPGACPSGSSLQFSNGTTQNLKDCWVNYFSNNYPKANTTNAPYCLTKVRHTNGITDTLCVAFPNTAILGFIGGSCSESKNVFGSGGSTAANKDLCEMVLTGGKSASYCLEKSTIKSNYSCSLTIGEDLNKPACLKAFSGGVEANNESACKQQLAKIDNYLNTTSWCCVFGNKKLAVDSKQKMITNKITEDTAKTACQTTELNLLKLYAYSQPNDSGVNWEFSAVFPGACGTWWNVNKKNLSELSQTCVTDATYQFLQNTYNPMFNAAFNGTPTFLSYGSYKQCATAANVWTFK